MKNFIKVFGIVMAVVCTMACSKQENEYKKPEEPQKPVEVVKVPMTFSVETTKTVLDGDGNVLFNSSDKISIFDGSGNNEFKNSTKDDRKPSVKFTGNADGEAGTYYALYPYQGDADLEGTTITGVILPAEQTATAGSFDPAANLSVAVTTNRSLRLMNVCTLLKIVVDAGEHYGKAVICSNDGSTLCGTINVSFNDGKPVATVTAASSSVTLTGTIGDNTNQTIYYIPVLPGTHAKGFYVKLYPTAESTFATATKYVGSSVTLERQNVANFGHIKPDVLPGEFTINSNGDKVRFARGNVFTPDDGVSYCLEAFQYDYHTIKSPSGGKFYSCVNGTKVLESRDSKNKGYLAQKNNSVSLIVGNVEGYGWRVPMQSELYYMLFQRTTNVTINDGTMSTTSARFVTAKVNDIPVLMIFPDSMTFPSDVEQSIKDWQTQNKYGFATYVNNAGAGQDWPKKMNFTIEQFNKLQSLGVVAIPGAGKYYNENISSENCVRIALSEDGEKFYEKCLSATSALVKTDQNTESYYIHIRLITDVKKSKQNIQ